MPNEASGLIVSGLVGGVLGIALRQPQVNRLSQEIEQLDHTLTWNQLQLNLANRSLESKDHRIEELERELINRDRNLAEAYGEIARLHELVPPETLELGGAD